jgi:hypothetical protein
MLPLLLTNLLHILLCLLPHILCGGLNVGNIVAARKEPPTNDILRWSLRAAAWLSGRAGAAGVVAGLAVLPLGLCGKFGSFTLHKLLEATSNLLDQIFVTRWILVCCSILVLHISDAVASHLSSQASTTQSPQKIHDHTTLT